MNDMRVSTLHTYFHAENLGRESSAQRPAFVSLEARQRPIAPWPSWALPDLRFRVRRGVVIDIHWQRLNII